ncbi:YbaB/EbfC family nucleoid-associated protein [Longispora albida]|uniref:YbaB/EbfC family nucleoid-associated protein n=1 Tax=Longispora albida TaxID=203523 RepID=UPI000381A5FC|nr:YbaB/EbfC family nucleoid-associated protein [Longispora albida]
MGSTADASGIGRMLADVTGLLAQFQAASQAGGEPAEGRGEAADGMIHATAAGGRITDLTFNPRVLRMDSVTLAEQTLAAVNAALADLAAQTPAPAGPADFGNLGEELKSIQDGAARQFATFGDALIAAQEQIASRGGK